MNYSCSQIAFVIGIACFLNACREHEKNEGLPEKVAYPDSFEIDFDALFDLTRPCELTPRLLESKVADLASVPREKLCRAVKLPQETCHYHWFSPTDAPVHNPQYSIFKSKIRPNFISVVWQEDAMERFYCVYPAAKDQEVPSVLLADMDQNLGVAHTFDGLLKQFEWNIEHYTVTAKYSTNVGKGDPCFLINVNNKKVSPRPRIAARQSAVQAAQVNLDEFFEWKSPNNGNVETFTAKVAEFEKSTGKQLRRGGKSSVTFYFDPSPGDAGNRYLLMAGHYQVSNAHFSWKDGRIQNIRVTLPPVQHGKLLTLSDEVSYLDTFFGFMHSKLQEGGDVWRWADCQVRFYKYANADSYCIELDRHVGIPLASAASPRTSTESSPSMPSGSSTLGPGSPSASSTSSSSASFKLRLTQVNGLLISQLSSGEEAGQVTKMILTALPNADGSPSKIEFNQSVGDSMLKSLNEVSKLSQLRHEAWPPGHKLEIGFADKYIAKDGPSAAVACALLVESAVTGKKWDPAFAVTGDLNADGSVQPIGGVRAKIRGATKGSCKLVAVPAKNERAVGDILLLDGPAPLVAITVFGIETFEDAILLATPERPENLQEALEGFEAMRAVMMRDTRQILPLLRSPHAITRLQALLAAAPECYSAKYLLLHAQGRAPRTLSIGGSIETAQSSAQAIINSIEKDVESNVSTLKPDEVGTSLNRLRSLRPKLDQRVWPYVDGLIDYGDVVRGAILNPVRSGARFADLVNKASKAAASAQAAFKALMNDAEVQEELGL